MLCNNFHVLGTGPDAVGEEGLEQGASDLRVTGNFRLSSMGKVLSAPGFVQLLLMAIQRAGDCSGLG